MSADPHPFGKSDLEQTHYAFKHGIVCPMCKSYSQVWVNGGRWLCHRVGCRNSGGLDVLAITPEEEEKIDDLFDRSGWPPDRQRIQSDFTVGGQWYRAIQHANSSFMAYWRDETGGWRSLFEKEPAFSLVQEIMRLRIGLRAVRDCTSYAEDVNDVCDSVRSEVDKLLK